MADPARLRDATVAVAMTAADTAALTRSVAAEILMQDVAEARVCEGNVNLLIWEPNVLAQIRNGFVSILCTASELGVPHIQARKNVGRS